MYSIICIIVKKRFRKYISLIATLNIFPKSSLRFLLNYAGNGIYGEFNKPYRNVRTNISLEKLLLLNFFCRTFKISTFLNSDVSFTYHDSDVQFFLITLITMQMEEKFATVWCNQMETDWKQTLFISLQLMNHAFKQILNKKITFSRHEFGRVGAFRIKIRLLVQKV